MNPLPFLLAGLLGATTNSAPTQTAVPAPSAPPPIQTTPATPFLHQSAPGVLDYNGVHLDKKNHRVSFPATVNQRQGLIEYILVNEKGKIHESLLATKILPHDIHLALLLIGLKDPTANSKSAVPPSAIDSSYLQSTPKLKGANVRVSVKWTQDGKEHEVPVEDWILNLDQNKPMSEGPWTYSGSMIENGVFLADQELSLIAVITDPTALVNNPRKGYDNDQIWQVKEALVPPMDSPVEIEITLGDSAQAKP